MSLVGCHARLNASELTELAESLLSPSTVQRPSRRHGPIATSALYSSTLTDTRAWIPILDRG